MRRIIFAALAVALVGAPTVALAQSTEQEVSDRPERRVRMHPGASILQAREALGLTDEQVARIEAIGARLAEQNRPIVEELRAERGERAREWRERRAALSPEERAQRRARMTPEQRAERRARMTPEQRAERRERMRERREAMEPRLRQLRENTRAAMTEMHEVLSEKQRARLQELREERRAEMREMMERRGEMRRAPGRRGAEQHRPDGESNRPR